MKFINIVDPHIKGKNPIRRKDNYTESVFNKFKEILELAIEEKCDFIICTGDWADAHTLSLTVLDRFIDLIESYNIPFYIVWGNHDMNNVNKSGTILEHIFNRSPIIKHLDTLEFDDLYIEGMDYTFTIDDDLTENGHFVEGKDDKWKIFIPHANFVPKKAIFTHVLAENFKTNFDVVATGHYHNQHKMQKIDNTTYLWTGSLTRGTIGASDVKKAPSVAILDSKDRSIREIKLKNVLPASEVFDLEKVAEEKDSKKDMKKYIESLKEVKLQGFKFIDKLNHYCKENDINDSIKSKILERMPNE